MLLQGFGHKALGKHFQALTSKPRPRPPFYATTSSSSNANNSDSSTNKETSGLDKLSKRTLSSIPSEALPVPGAIAPSRGHAGPRCQTSRTDLRCSCATASYIHAHVFPSPAYSCMIPQTQGACESYPRNSHTLASHNRGRVSCFPVFKKIHNRGHASGFPGFHPPIFLSRKEILQEGITASSH